MLYEILMQWGIYNVRICRYDYKSKVVVQLTQRKQDGVQIQLFCQQHTETPCSGVT